MQNLKTTISKYEPLYLFISIYLFLYVVLLQNQATYIKSFYVRYYHNFRDQVTSKHSILLSEYKVCRVKLVFRLFIPWSIALFYSWAETFERITRFKFNERENGNLTKKIQLPQWTLVKKADVIRELTKNIKELSLP